MSQQIRVISTSHKGTRAEIVVVEVDPVTGKKTSKTRHVRVNGDTYEHVKVSEYGAEQVDEAWDQGGGQ